MLNGVTGFTFKRNDGLIYNSVEQGAFMPYKPEIPSSVRQVESVEILGADSSLTYDNGAYKDKPLTIPIFFMSYDPVKEFNYAFMGFGGELKFNYKDGYYLVKTIDNIFNRDAKGIPEIDLFVTVAPFLYKDKVIVALPCVETKKHSFKNSGNIDSLCNLSINYSGNCEFELNGNRFIITDTRTGLQNINIDSVRNEVYQGTDDRGTLVAGDMDKARIKSGTNDVDVILGDIQSIKIEYNPRVYE